MIINHNESNIGQISSTQINSLALNKSIIQLRRKSIVKLLFKLICGRKLLQMYKNICVVESYSTKVNGGKENNLIAY